MTNRLRLGLPKGSLEEATLRLFERAGYTLNGGERTYVLACSCPELKPILLRAQEIPTCVAHGTLDAGISGLDCIRDARADVVEVADLPYARRGPGVYRWVVAVPQASAIRTPADLAGKAIATELVHVADDYLARLSIHATVVPSRGATEAKLMLGLADAIIEGTETGATLAEHRLRIVDDVLASTPRLMANHGCVADQWKWAQLKTLGQLLRGALTAMGKVLLKFNIPAAALAQVVPHLPAVQEPTVGVLRDPWWRAVETVVDRDEVHRLVPALLAAGATGILECPVTKIITP